MSNPDKWNTFTAQDLAPIAPSDSADLPIWARAIRCRGNAGTLRITTISGQVRDTSIDFGEVLLVGARRVHATGTTATTLEALV
jgi:hypothetical protein